MIIKENASTMGGTAAGIGLLEVKTHAKLKDAFKTCLCHSVWTLTLLFLQIAAILVSINLYCHLDNEDSWEVFTENILGVTDNLIKNQIYINITLILFMQ